MNNVINPPEDTVAILVIVIAVILWSTVKARKLEYFWVLLTILLVIMAFRLV